MPLTNGSESGSRNRFPAAFYHQSSNAKTTSFLYTFCLLLQGYVHIEVKEPQHNRYQGSLLFYITIEGSRSGFGSGSIPLINGSRSGSRRPKTHVDAADSDPVFGSGSATLFYRKPFSGSKTRIFSLAHVKEEFSLGLFFYYARY
jgi:hypothetical protein